MLQNQKESIYLKTYKISSFQLNLHIVNSSYVFELEYLCSIYKMVGDIILRLNNIPQRRKRAGRYKNLAQLGPNLSNLINI